MVGQAREPSLIEGVEVRNRFAEEVEAVRQKTRLSCKAAAMFFSVYERGPAKNKEHRENLDPILDVSERVT